MQQTQRRHFLITTGALLAVPLSSFAQQQQARIPRIGFLGLADPTAWSPRVDAFRSGLRDLGYVEGKNITIEFRFAEGQYDRLPALAAELVRLNVDVIVTHAVPGALAAKRATATNPIPVVMTNVGDAVGAGIVASLARPGGNITGDTFYVTELAAKRLEVLKDAIPGMRQVAVLANPDNALTGLSLQSMEIAAKGLNVALLSFPARGPADLDGVFAAMAKQGVDALTVIEDAGLIPTFKRIAELATRQRLPSISFIEYADAGGLFGYGTDYLALYRRAAVFVDKILKGAKPADIPIERPTTFNLVINMKTARALDFAIPQTMLLRADKVIE
jgi:putative tryptophan/tyrosine transport system substrate-binding protein